MRDQNLTVPIDQVEALILDEMDLAGNQKQPFAEYTLTAIHWICGCDQVYGACEPGCDVPEVLGKIVRGRKLSSVNLKALQSLEPKKAVKVRKAFLELVQ